METSQAQPRLARISLPGWLIAILYLIVVAALPLLLVLINARLMMSPLFLRVEYARLPEDIFGFTHEERVRFGSAGLNYLFNSDDIDFLGDLTFADGSSLFKESELSHMDDVKVVTRKLTQVGFVLLAVYSVAVALLAVSGDYSRNILMRGLFQGALLTIALLVAGVATVALAFNWLFTQFHNLFFASGTWTFPTSDTLIRLYPEQFWVDAFAFLFGGALLEAVVLAAITWRSVRRSPQNQT